MLSDEDKTGIIIYSIIIAFGFLYCCFCHILARCCPSGQDEDSSPSTPTQPRPVEEVVRPQQSQYSDVTVVFYEELRVNGYERGPEAMRQTQGARENRFKPSDNLPQYHELADVNLPSYHEAINYVDVFRIENEKY